MFVQLDKTALHLAAEGGHNEVIGYLLNHGVKVDDVDRVS